MLTVPGTITPQSIQASYGHLWRSIAPSPALDVARIEQARRRATGRAPDPQLKLALNIDHQEANP